MHEQFVYKFLQDVQHHTTDTYACNHNLFYVLNLQDAVINNY